MKHLVLGLSLLASPIAHAAGAAPKTDVIKYRNSDSTNKRNMLEGVALNAAEASRTLELWNNQRMSSLKVIVDYTYSAATAVTIAYYCTLDLSTWAQVVVRDFSTAPAAGVVLQDSFAVTGDATFQYIYGVGGCEKVKFIFGGTGADGSDLINVQTIAVVGE